MLSAILGLALTAGLATAQSCKYPGIESDLAACKTGAALCAYVLGRGPVTSTVTVKGVYTTTVPATTLTYSEIYSATVHKSTTLPVSTAYATVCAAATSSGSATGVAQVPAAATAVFAPAAAYSCGVGSFPTAWVSNACECEYDHTTYIAGKTHTKTTGYTQTYTTGTITTTTTSISYLSTVTATTTIYHENCVPPAYADCNNPATCDDYVEYECGINYYDECFCGIDSNNIGTCFESGGCDVTCTFDYDCPSGNFCLYESCCGEPICAPYDICLGDQTYPSATSSGTGSATQAFKPKQTKAPATKGKISGPGLSGFKFGKMA